MTDKDTLLALVAGVNATAVLDVTAQADYLSETAPAVSVQLLPGSRWAQRYVDGSGTREIPFAVIYRSPAPTDVQTRVDAASTLMRLATSLEAADERITGTDTPSLFERAANGSEVWRETFVLDLEVRK